MLMDYSVQSSIILYFKRCVCVCVIWCMYVWCHETWGSVIAFYLVSDREQILVFIAVNARLAGTLASRDSLVSLPPTLPALLLDTCYCNRALSVFWAFKLRFWYFCSRYSIHWAIAPSLLLIVLPFVLSYHMAQKGVASQFCTFLCRSAFLVHILR